MPSGEFFPGSELKLIKVGRVGGIDREETGVSGPGFWTGGEGIEVCDGVDGIQRNKGNFLWANFVYFDHRLPVI